MGKASAEAIQRGRAKRSAGMIEARKLGSHTAAEWAEKVEASAGRCEYCGRGRQLMTQRDHKTPVVLGGSDAIDNLAVVCWDCNEAKCAMTLNEFVDWAAAVGFFHERRRRQVRSGGRVRRMGWL